MEFLLDGEGYSIRNDIPTNNSPSPDTPASLFGFHCAGNSQLLDGFPQLHQKMKNPADNERLSPEKTEGFMIASNGAQAVQRRPVPASMSKEFKYAEATTELRRPSASLSVNGGGSAKVRKKRSRVPKKVPTTLLNTDTANFKAMVQCFTGNTATPFGFSSMNPTYSAHVGQQELQLLGKPLTYKAVLDPNMSCVSHLDSVPDCYRPHQHSSTRFLPFQSLHDYRNISSPLNLFPKAPQGQFSNAAPLDDGQFSNAAPPDDVGLINSASVFPTLAMTLPSDRTSAYLI
jgi:hypothetical protein